MPLWGIFVNFHIHAVFFHLFVCSVFTIIHSLSCLLGQLHIMTHLHKSLWRAIEPSQSQVSQFMLLPFAFHKIMRNSFYIFCWSFVETCHFCLMKQCKLNSSIPFYDLFDLKFLLKKVHVATACPRKSRPRELLSSFLFFFLLYKIMLSCLHILLPHCLPISKSRNDFHLLVFKIWLSI